MATTLMWACLCETVNPLRKRHCQSCGAKKPHLVAVPVPRGAPPTPLWVPRGPRPCTDVENKAAIEIIQAVISKRMTVAEAEAHLHTIFKGRELP